MSRRIALFTAVVLVALLVGTTRPANALLSFTCDSVTPSQIVPGVANQQLKLSGSGFAGDPTVAFDPPDGIAVVGSPVVASSSELDVTVTVAANAPTVPRTVTVTQSFLNGGEQTCAHGVTVGPDITSVSGPLSNNGTTGSFTITGHAFVANSTVKIARTGYGFNGAETDTQTATVETTTSTSITANVSTLGRAPGFWKVTVQKDSGTATFGNGTTTGLQILGNKPTLTTLTLSRINHGETNKSIALVGKSLARGLTVTVSGTGVTQAAATEFSDMTHATLHLTAASNATPGLRDVTITNADGEPSSYPQALGVDVDVPDAGTPTIGTLTPNTLGQGASHLAVVVAGTNFGPTPDVTVTPSGSPTGSVTVDGVTRDSATQLTLALSSTADALGSWSLTVANGSHAATKTNALSVISTFSVTGLTPPGRPQNYNGNFVINGSGFTGTPTVSIAGGSDVTTGTVVRDSAARLTVPVTVTAGAALTSRNVTVTNNGTPITCNNCFTVGKVPTLTSITPATGGGGGQVAITDVSGAFFVNPSVTLERTGQSNIPLTEVTNDASHIQGTFDLTNAAPGKWNVRVTNLDGGTAAKTDAFTVVFAAPSFADPPPDFGSVPQNTPSTVLHVTGFNFAPGMTVSFTNPAGVSVTDVLRKSTTAADVTVSTADNAALGSRDLKVTNADGQSATCTACFAVVQGNQKQFFGTSFIAYPNFEHGVFVAAGHLGGPTLPMDIVTGANAGGGPHVRAFAVNPTSGSANEVSGLMAYDTSFPGGVRVAVGDINGDGTDEIITGAGPGGGPHVKVFHINNDTSVSQPFGGGFFAYDAAFSGGVWVAAGDVNGDGKDEIITGAGSGGGPHVRVWTLAADGHSFQEIGSFFAYASAFSGGVAVAAGNMIPEDPDAPVIDEIATAPGPGGGPHVRVFNKAGAPLRELFNFTSNDVNGYRVAVGDFDFDAVDDLAISHGSSSPVYVAHLIDAAPGYEAIVLPDPEPLGTAVTSGTNVAAGDVDADGDDDLIAAPDHDSTSIVRMMRPLSHNT